jgi:hypothetical protein
VEKKDLQTKDLETEHLEAEHWGLVEAAQLFRQPRA